MEFYVVMVGGGNDTVSLQFSPDDDIDKVAEVVSAIQKIPSQFEGYDSKW